MKRGASRIARITLGKHSLLIHKHGLIPFTSLLFGFLLLDILLSICTCNNKEFFPSVNAVLPTGELQFKNLDLEGIYTGDSSNFVSKNGEDSALYVEGASFGKELWESKKKAPTLIALLPSGYLDGCDLETSNFDYYTKSQEEYQSFVAVFQRGNCSFGQKVHVGEKAGASAVFIMNTLQGIYFNRSEMVNTFDFDCSNGEGWIADEDLMEPKWNPGNNVPTCSEASSCESKKCLLTGVVDENKGNQVCCAWDLFVSMAPDPKIDPPPSIPSIYMTMKEGDALNEALYKFQGSVPPESTQEFISTMKTDDY